MKSNKDEAKYHMLRNLCDKEKYLQAIDYGSLDLIEALMNDFLSLKRLYARAKEDIKDLQERNENLTLGITAYKHQNQELFTQNAELHREIITLSEKINYKGKELELNRLNEDTTSLKFMLNEAEKKNKKLQNEIIDIKQKYMELIVDIYEKKVNMQKLFSELKDEEQISVKPRGVALDDLPDNDDLKSKSSNMRVSNKFNMTEGTNSNFNNTQNSRFQINNNNTNINNTNMIGTGNNFNGNRNSKLRGNNKELIEKVYKLESELKEKNNELNLLKKNMYSENIVEQKVVIDYLRGELKRMKDKYEFYLNFEIEKKNSVYNKPKKKEIKKKPLNNIEETKVPPTTKERLESRKNKRMGQEYNNLKSKYDDLLKQFKACQKELKEVVKKYNESQNYIQNELENELANYNSNHQYSKSNNTDVNIITSLSQKLKESESSLNSSQKQFKSSLNELAKINERLKRENNNLKDQIKFKDQSVNDYKEKLNELNKQIFQINQEEEENLINNQ